MEAIRLPRPDKSGLAMTQSGELDKSSNYKNDARSKEKKQLP
jgi:hypothetical protein